MPASLPQSEITKAAMLALQLLLFGDLPIPPDSEPRTRRGWRSAPRNYPAWVQLGLKLTTRRSKAAQDIEDTSWDFPEHRITSAAECQAPAVCAPNSVFALAGYSVVASIQSASAETIHRRVIREAGVTRHIAMRYQDTDEWAEKERIRRAKQRPPKPPKAAETRGAKLLEMIGGGNG